MYFHQNSYVSLIPSSSIIEGLFEKKERISFRNKPFKKLREKEKKKCMIGNVKEVNESGGL